MSERKDQIESIKKSALNSIDQKVRMSAISALAEYGEEGITSITEIVDNSVGSEVKLHGMDKITEIKSNKK